MFSADLQVLDFTAEDWLRLPQVFTSRSKSPTRSSGGIIAVRRGDRIVKMISTLRGRLPPPEAGQASAQTLAEQHQASFAIVLSTTALEQLGDRFARRLERGQSFHAQVEAFVGGMRELEQEGETELWPTRFADWPLPTERAFESALDLLCSDGKALVLGAFEDGALYTAVALRRRGRALDVIMGPDRLRRDMGLLSGDFTRDYRYLSAAVEARLGPIAAGCYAELDTFQRLAADPAPGAWASAVAARDVVLTPVTPGLAVPLSIDAGRAALSFARGALERFGVLQGLRGKTQLGGTLERAYAYVESDVRHYLGFDPWRLLTSWLGGRA
jgi:hypothetical protein